MIISLAVRLPSPTHSKVNRLRRKLQGRLTRWRITGAGPEIFQGSRSTAKCSHIIGFEDHPGSQLGFAPCITPRSP